MVGHINTDINQCLCQIADQNNYDQSENTPHSFLNIFPMIISVLLLYTENEETQQHLSLKNIICFFFSPFITKSTEYLHEGVSREQQQYTRSGTYRISSEPLLLCSNFEKRMGLSAWWSKRWTAES